MSKLFRIPVTILKSETTTAYVVFDIEGEDEETQMQNILALENLELDELTAKANLSIKPITDVNKFPPQLRKTHHIHVMDAEPF